MSCKDCEVTRRSFLVKSGAAFGGLALADPLWRMMATSYGQTSGGTGNILVLCQLNGGLDALSFLAPFANSTYQANRPRLALRADQVHVLPDNGEYGINRQFGFMSQLYNQGDLAIVQQVGYPGANGSHFESQEIFEYGVRNLGSQANAGTTWYERLRKTYFNEPFGVLDTRKIGDPTRYGYPDSTYRRGAQDAFGRLAAIKSNRTQNQQALLDTYRRIDELGEEIRTRTSGFQSSGTSRGDFFRAAQLASAGLGTRIFKCEYGGFDTHGSQITANATLFPRLDNDFRQFAQDMQNIGLWDRTVVLFYTEFGRRNRENGSPGTDHGAGGHIMLAGPRVSGGLKGQNVTSYDMSQGSLPYYVDFRAVFSNAIQNWLGFDPNPIFRIGDESFDANAGGTLFA